MSNRLLISLFTLQVVSFASAFDPGFEDVEYGGPGSLRKNIGNVKRNLTKEYKTLKGNTEAVASLETPEGRNSYYGNYQADLKRLEAMKPHEYLRETRMGWLARKLQLNDPNKMTEIEKIYYKALDVKINRLGESIHSYKCDLNRSKQDLEQNYKNVENMIAELKNLKAQKVAKSRGMPYYNYREPISPFAQRVRNWFGYK